MENKMAKEDQRFLSVRDLVVEYRSEGKTVHAVNGVSFDLAKGKTLGLVGETGAGKTSIAKAILRILPDHSTQRAEGTWPLRRPCEKVNMFTFPCGRPKASRTSRASR